MEGIGEGSFNMDRRRFAVPSPCFEPVSSVGFPTFADPMLRSVDTSNRPVWDLLVQAYEYEFSRITGKLPEPDGRMLVDTHLGGAIAGWICWNEGRPAGFAAVVDHGDEREVAEFYVVPAFRGRGFGRDLASALFDRAPGSWVVKQLVEATAAQSFWKKVLADLPCQGLREETFVDPYWGMVVCQKFQWSPDLSGAPRDLGIPVPEGVPTDATPKD